MEGAVEGLLASGMDGVGVAVMDLIGGHQADPGMVMILIVPSEEAAAEVLGILDAAEAFWEFRLIFQGFEVSFGKRVVVGGMGPAVRLGDAEVGEQEGGRLGLHGAAAVGMQGELAGPDGVLGDGVIEQRLEQGGALGIGDTPADDPATEDVENDVEIEVGSIRVRSTHPS
jgi:hypothetical protein